MMEMLTDRFAPGPLFAWLALVFLCMIPMVWIRFFRSRLRATIRFSSVSRFLIGPSRGKNEPSTAAASTGRPVPSSWAVKARVVLPMLRTCALLAMVVALARPQLGGEYRDSSEGIAVQMVLDVSGSMSEEDFVMAGRRARRLDAVKQVFEDFVLGRAALKGRDNDLIGMTTFAMYADTRCPLTRDHGSLVDLLRQTEIPGWVDGRQVREDQEAGFTALGDAIVLATDDLRRAGEQAARGVPGAEAAKSRVMILLTDGANNPARQFQRTSPDPVEAAQLAAKLGIKIYTIGAGGDQSRQRQGFFMPRGQTVDEGALERIAEATGGRYFRATDTESLVTIYDEIDQLERTKTGERIYQDDVYAAKVGMIVGLALLLVELLLANTRFRTLP